MEESHKPILVYVNPDYFTQVDDTVLCHLTEHFVVHWIYLYESFNADSMRYNEQYVNEYGRKHNIATKVFYVNKHGRNPAIYLFYRQIAKYINKIKPNIVYHCIRNPFWGFVIKTTLDCKNVVMGIHDAKAHSYSLSVNSILNTMFRDVILRFHSHFITFSKNQHDLLLKNYGINSQMVGMSYKSFGKPSVARPDIDSGIRFLFFGGIHLYKGLDLFIQAIEDLSELAKKQNAIVTIAGKGPHWDLCKSLIKYPELFEIKNRFIDNDEIPDLMNKSHFLVLPYRNATQSGPLVAAMAYGLPIIAPDFGCFSETYDNSSAILYSPGHIKDAVMKALSLNQEDYDKMRHNCSVISQTHSEESVAQRYIEYFKLIIKKNK